MTGKDLEKDAVHTTESETALADQPTNSDGIEPEATESSKSESIQAYEDDFEENQDYEIGYNEEFYDLDNGGDALQRTLTLERVQTIKSLSADIPDKFSGWGLSSVIGSAILNMNTWGSNSAYAIYLQEYLNNDIFSGATKIDFGIVGGLCFASGLTFSPLINRLVGIIGIKQTMLIGTAVQFAGLLLSSFSKKLWHVFLTQGVLQGVGMAMIAVPSVLIVPQWFKSGPGGKRNLAIGIGAAGSGIGGIIYNVGMDQIMIKYSWRWALRSEAIMTCVLNIVAAFMLKSRDKQVKPIYKVYDKKVWSNFGIMMMIVWEAFTLLGYVTLMYNLSDFTRSMGYGSKEASVVATMIAVGIIYGRPSVGQVADRIGPVQATILASWLVSLFAFAMWIPCKNYATAIVFAMFEGSLMGTIWISMSTINGSIIGLRKFGIGMSLSWIATGVFGFASPIIGIALKSNGAESRLQYRHPAIFVGCVYFGAGATLCVLRGWLLARNKMCHGHVTEEERLSISVKPIDALKCMFEFSQKV